MSISERSLAKSLASCIGLVVVAISPVHAAPGVGKVDLCHATPGGFQPISVSANALQAHLKHGDIVQPNGAVPGGQGYVFDAKCRPVTWGYAVNVAPDLAAQDPASPGNLFVGSGVPATNFGTARNEAAGIELGMMVLYRQGPNVASFDDYSDGILNFNVASGPQSTSNGSFSSRTDRAAWNYTFSIATGLNGVTTNLSNYTFQLLVDVDPGPGTNFRVLTLEAETSAQAPGQSGFQWRDQASNLVPIFDDEGTPNVTQNSQNYVFLGPLSAPYIQANGFAGPAKFDIILQAFDGTQLIARNHIVVNVAQ